MAKRKLLYYGLQRSGTNFLSKIVEQHYDVDFLNKTGDRRHPSHKHFRIYDNKKIIIRENYKNNLQISALEDLEAKLAPEDQPEGYIIISKDPYSWLISYEKWAKSMKWPKPPHHFILEYNEFYRKWLELSFSSDRIILIRYSDLLVDGKKTLDEVASLFKLDRHDPDNHDVEQIRKVPRSSRFTEKKLEYYSEEHFMKKYSKKKLQEINKFIDHDLIKKLGYKSYF